MEYSPLVSKPCVTFIMFWADNVICSQGRFWNLGIARYYPCLLCSYKPRAVQLEVQKSNEGHGRHLKIFWQHSHAAHSKQYNEKSD